MHTLEHAISFLSQLIVTPSPSGQEHLTATLIAGKLESQGFVPHFVHNNVYARSWQFDETKPTLLLCSHHDTVKPSTTYTRDPFSADRNNRKIFGLGSNDAGGALVTLMTTFLKFGRGHFPYNLIFLAAAEEEISGPKGLESVLPHLGPLSFAIIGEPTSMKVATAEKGLLVVDAVAFGRAGHAAHNEGENAITVALQDIAWIHSYAFERTSALLGPIKMTVTKIQAGTQHNVIPDRCAFVIDIRLTEAYTSQEVMTLLTQHIRSTLTPRSHRLKPTATPLDHPIMRAVSALDLPCFGSATLSDQALLTIPSLKMGPGLSLRSHVADEYLEISELAHGLATYDQLFTLIQSRNLQ